jgi:hypothetical protein
MATFFMAGESCCRRYVGNLSCPLFARKRRLGGGAIESGGQERGLQAASIPDCRKVS